MRPTPWPARLLSAVAAILIALAAMSGLRAPPAGWPTVGLTLGLFLIAASISIDPQSRAVRLALIVPAALLCFVGAALLIHDAGR